MDPNPSSNFSLSLSPARRTFSLIISRSSPGDPTAPRNVAAPARVRVSLPPLVTVIVRPAALGAGHVVRLERTVADVPLSRQDAPGELRTHHPLLVLVDEIADFPDADDVGAGGIDVEAGDG